MPARKAYHHGDLRQALLAAALDILEEGGTSALSLRETARSVGVSAMAPYRHFADREALLAGVATIGFERLEATIILAEAGRVGQVAIVAQGRAYVDFALANPALFRLMFGATATHTPDLVRASDRAYGALSRCVAAALGPARSEDWTLACWSMVHGIAMLALDGKLDWRAEPVDVLADRLLHLFGAGFVEPS